MSIVLQENKWAEQMIIIKSLGKKPSETLRRVARYYIDQGFSTKEVRRKLDIFLIQCDPQASIPKWEDTLQKVMKAAVKYPAIDIESIDITKGELDVISRLSSPQVKRLAFTLLCLAKYWNCVRGSVDGWVNNQDTEIMSMANIKSPIKKRSSFYTVLKDAGLIQFSRKIDNTNVKVCFIDNASEPVLQVTDFRNLGYQYLMYLGEDYFVCENCGLVTKIKEPNKHRNQKYCPDCAIKVKIKKSVESVMRNRA